MHEYHTITRQVLRNCSISDARYAGLFSICGLALRLRDLYKWEKGLEPWVEKNASEIAEWIGEKENTWDELSQTEFVKITISGRSYDPFDAGSINGAIEPHGLLYGAGYAYGLKPSFFLAPIECIKEIDGHRIYILGRELARDLLTTPALSQNKRILIRRQSAKFFLWDNIFFIKKSGRQALNFALESYGLKEPYLADLHHHLEKIFDDEIGTYIYHELGEIKDTIFDRTIWQEVIAALPNTPVELLVRAVKDLLADTNEYGTLRYITSNRKAASLALYIAFLDGIRKLLFPELTAAFKEFAITRNWMVIEQAVLKGFSTAKHYAETICSIYTAGKQDKDVSWARSEIEKRLLTPLGIAKDSNF
jgi:hypothetical protein